MKEADKLVNSQGKFHVRLTSTQPDKIDRINDTLVQDEGHFQGVTKAQR